MRLFALFLAGYLLLGGLFPMTDFGQLRSTARLWGHFQEHRLEARTQGDDISIIDFLWAHYLQIDSHEHAQPGSHANLPLQQLNSVLHLICVHSHPWRIFPRTLIAKYRPAFLEKLSPLEWAIDIDRPPIVG